MQVRLFPASLVEISSSLRSGSTDVLDYVAEVCGRIGQTEPVVRSLVDEVGREARLVHEATRLNLAYPGPESRPPLFGVLAGIKDLYNVDGFPTQAGSHLPSRLFRGPEASLVSRMRDLGAIILGKTAMDEFAYADPAPTRNPHNPAHTPGGSSSGSAAAVAAGISPLCIGTQTTRSVIAPASFCGVVGFKPTYGRVPLDGVVPTSPSLDTAGFFTQDVESMVVAAAALVPAWKVVTQTRQPVLGIPEGKYMTFMTDDMKNAFYSRVDELRAAGFTVKPIQMPWEDKIDDIYTVTLTLLHGEMFRIHAQWVPEYRALYRERSLRGIESGRHVTDQDLDFCRATQNTLRKDIENWMDEYGVDVWITPSQGDVAPRGDVPTGWGGMTIPWSLAGLPSISIPAGKLNGLPYGIQFVARFGDDESLLHWACNIAQVVQSGN